MIIDCENPNESVASRHQLLAVPFREKRRRQPGAKGRGRFRVRRGIGDNQFDLGARVDLAPNIQLAAHKSGPFVHATQAEVPSASAPPKDSLIESFSIVLNPQSKLRIVILNFHRDLIDFVPDNWV
jgi:hypothetical protein